MCWQNELSEQPLSHMGAPTLRCLWDPHSGNASIAAANWGSWLLINHQTLESIPVKLIWKTLSWSLLNSKRNRKEMLFLPYWLLLSLSRPCEFLARPVLIPSCVWENHWGSAKMSQEDIQIWHHKQWNRALFDKNVQLCFHLFVLSTWFLTPIGVSVPCSYFNNLLLICFAGQISCSGCCQPLALTILIHNADDKSQCNRKEVPGRIQTMTK